MLDMSIKKFLYTFYQKNHWQSEILTSSRGTLSSRSYMAQEDFCDTKGGGNFFLGTIPTQFAKDHSRGFLLDHAVTSFLYFAHYLCSSDYHYTLFVLKVKRFHAQNVHK